MLHDWFKHGTSPTDNPWVLPAGPGDDWPEPPVAGHARSGRPHRHRRTRTCHRPTSTSTPTGGTGRRSTATTSRRSSGSCARAPAAGCGWSTGCRRSRTTRARTRRCVPGFWLGLGMMQTLFALEHNAIATCSAAAHPRVRRRDAVPAGPADHVRAARQDPHRRVDARGHRPPDRGRRAARQLVRPGRANGCTTRSGGSAAARSSRGIPGADTDDYGVPFALTEEFVAVYRMHPLIPDDFDFRSAADDAPTLGPRQFDRARPARRRCRSCATSRARSTCSTRSAP